MVIGLDGPGAAAPRPPAGTRLVVAVCVAGIAAFGAWYFGTRFPHFTSDLDQMWAGARAFRSGRNPYVEVGPGRAFDWPWLLFYPFPAMLLVWPLSYLTPLAARAVFLGASAGLLAYGLTRGPAYRLLLFASASFVTSITFVQWSPLLTASLFFPWLGVAYAAKPNWGAMMWLARPTRVSALAAAALLGLAFLVWPGWVGEWLEVVREAGHVRAPLTIGPGVLLLAALLRWRRPEARLLLAMATVPHTVEMPAALPLFLVPASRKEMLTLVGLSFGALVAEKRVMPIGTQAEYFGSAGLLVVLLLYLPALVMVLRRPNAGEVPEALERLATRVARGRSAGRLPRPGSERLPRPGSERSEDG